MFIMVAFLLRIWIRSNVEAFFEGLAFSKTAEGLPGVVPNALPVFFALVLRVALRNPGEELAPFDWKS